MNIVEAIPHRPEADSFQFQVSLGNLKQAVVARVWVVVLTTVVTTALVIAYIWIWPPTYQVEVMVAFDSEEDVPRNTFYDGWNVFRMEGLSSEGALLTSPPVLRETVRRLDLKYADVYHPFFSYVTHLWGESWIGKTYRKVKHWIFPKQPGPYEPTPEEIEQYKVLADFRQGVAAERVRTSNVGLLIVKASSQRVAEIANTIADVYLDQRRERQVREADQAHASLTEEVKKIEREVDALDQEIAKFRSENGVLLQFEKDKVQIVQFQGQRQAVAELEAQIADKTDALEVINRSLAAESTFMNSSRVFKDTVAQDRVTRLEAQLAQARQLFQPDSREVREIEEQIRIAMANIEGKQSSVVVRNAASVGLSYEQLRARKVALESQLAGDRAALQKKREELERLRVLLEDLPEKMRISRDYERKQSAQENRLMTLYQKLAVVTVSLATARSAPPALRVVDYAVPPEKPVWPKTKLFLLAAVLFGLLLGVMAALLLELAFVRVSRYRLWERGVEYRVFAVVDQDEKFLKALYAWPAEPKLIGRAGRS